MTAKELPNSGRSTQSIIGLANYLVDWSRDGASRPRAARGPRRAATIEPTPPGDPQPNPPDDPEEVRLIGRRYAPEEEVDDIVSSLSRWLADHPDRTMAVLTPSNDRGERFVTA